MKLLSRIAFAVALASSGLALAQPMKIATNGSNVTGTQRYRLNLIGTFISCANNGSTYSYDCTWNTNVLAGRTVLATAPSTNQVLAWNGIAWAPADASGGTPTSRAISTTSPLQGGGDLSADRTLSIASGGIGNSLLTNSTVSISTSSPLGGGGSVALGAGLTLTCAACVTTSGTYADPAWITSISGGKISGAVATATSATTATNFSGSLVGDVGGTQSATVLASVGPGAGTIGGGGAYVESVTLDAKGRVTAATTATPSGGVPSSRAINTTSPLGGGATLAGDLTLTCTTCTTANTGALGDLFYATSTGVALTRLADVAAGAYLRSGGVGAAPLWSTLTLPNAATTGQVLVATGTNAIGAATSLAGLSLTTMGTLSHSAADAHGVTITPQLTLENSTAATVGAQKRSGAISFLGRGWKTTATAGSQTTGWTLDMLPIQATTNPSASLVMSSIINAGTATPRFNFVWDNVNSQARIYGASTTAAYIQLNAGDMRLFGGSGSSQGIRFESNNFFPTAAGQINLGTNTFPFAAVEARQHVAVEAAKPTCTVGAAAGTGATCSLLAHSTHHAGQVTVSTGTTPTAGTTFVTVQSSLGPDSAIYCTAVPANANTAADALTGGMSYYVTSKTTGGAMFDVIHVGVVAPDASAASGYVFNYTCFEASSVP